MAIRLLFTSLLALVGMVGVANAQAVGTCPGGVNPSFAGCLPAITSSLTATDGVNVLQGGRPSAIWGVAGIGQLLGTPVQSLTSATLNSSNTGAQLQMNVGTSADGFAHDWLWGRMHVFGTINAPDPVSDSQGAASKFVLTENATITPNTYGSLFVGNFNGASGSTDPTNTAARNALQTRIVAQGQIGATPTLGPGIVNSAFVSSLSTGYATASQGGLGGWSGGLNPGVGYYRGSMFGGNDNVWLASGAANYFYLIGREIDTSLQGTSNAYGRYGLLVPAFPSTKQADGLEDSAIGLISIDNTGNNFKNGIQFGSATQYGAFSNALIRTMARTQPVGLAASVTVPRGVDFSDAVFSDAAWKSPGATIGGTGILSAINLPIDVTAAPYNVSSAASDNATALQSAINDAISAGRPLAIPTQSACYKYTAPLTIAGDLTIVGTNVGENWASGINVPLGTPPLVGSVLCPTSNGSDAIDITGASRRVNISNIGILFQTPFSGTGDGINYIPSGTNQGLSGSVWQNVIVYGHDGNHYATNLQNFIYDTFITPRSYGGGAMNLSGSSASLNYGNSTFIQPYGQVVVGGTANGFTITASASQRLNLLTFVRPQAITNNAAGVTPGGNPPTSTQDIWHQDALSTNVRTIAPDFETNVGSGLTTGTSAKGNDFDWAGAFTSATAINAPAWGTNGILYGPVTRTFTDTTSSGATGVTGVAAFPGTHVNATSSTTYSALATLYVPPPILGTNVAATRTAAIYSTGEIFTTGDFSSTSGAFISGTTQLNKNATTNTTEIGDGTTSGQVTIGGTANKTAIASALMTGSATPLTLATGEIGLTKITASGSSPGAAGLKIAAVCGTNAGTAKIIAAAGTSATAVTILDNIGAGVTGC